MFELDSQQSYMMPAHFGPRHVGDQSSGWYHDVTSMVVSYKTDRDKLATYLPKRFQASEEAIVSVVYACNKQVDWLAGHGYNLIGVNAPVTYESKEEQLEGNYTLVMWESLTDPILNGREKQGIPKIFATIPDHHIADNIWRSTANHFGNKIIDLCIDQLRPPSEAEIEAYAASQENKDNPMAWRYLPAMGGLGPAAIDEPTLFPSDNQITEAYVGNGSVEWQHLSWEQNPTQYHIVNALADLPILEYLPALVTRGKTNVLPGRTRKLR